MCWILILILLKSFFFLLPSCCSHHQSYYHYAADLLHCPADGNEGPARVAALLRQNPPAGKAFCASLCQGAPAQQVAELIAALHDHLLSSAPAATGVPDPAAPGAAPAAAAAKGSKRRRGRKQARADEQPPEVVPHALGPLAGLSKSVFR